MDRQADRLTDRQDNVYFRQGDRIRKRVHAQNDFYPFERRNNKFV